MDPATMHDITDGCTDRQTDGSFMPLADDNMWAVQSAKNAKQTYVTALYNNTYHICGSHQWKLILENESNIWLYISEQMVCVVIWYIEPNITFIFQYQFPYIKILFQISILKSSDADSPYSLLSSHLLPRGTSPQLLSDSGLLLLF